MTSAKTRGAPSAACDDPRLVCQKEHPEAAVPALVSVGCTEHRLLPSQRKPGAQSSIEAQDVPHAPFAQRYGVQVVSAPVGLRSVVGEAHTEIDSHVDFTVLQIEPELHSVESAQRDVHDDARHT